MDFDDIIRRTYRSLEWERLKGFLAHEADSQPGKQACQEVEPAVDRHVIERLLEETNEAVSVIEARSALSLNGLPDLSEGLARLQANATLTIGELLELRQTLAIVRQVKGSLSLLPGDAFPRLYRFVERLFLVNEVFQAIDIAIDDSGSVKDEASPALRKWRRELHRLDRNIKDELTRIIQSTTLSKALQEPIFTQRNGRYVLPVNASMRATIKGIVHDSSASGLTVFVEPMSVVELANSLRLTESEIEHEIARILQDLSSKAAGHLPEIRSSYETAVELDLILSRARLALRYGGHMPELSKVKQFCFRQARHPLLVLQNPAKVSEIIANDIALGGTGEGRSSADPSTSSAPAGRTLIITGPNTGGKTVLLKTVGIFALMVRAGLLPSAKPGSIACIFSHVCADIGDEQSLEQSLSTFSSHMTNIVEIARHADQEMLALLDEVGAGTDPHEGAALARAVLERLNGSGAITITTTHYGELKTLAYTEEGFVNGSLEFNEVTLSPTYRLRIGMPGSSKATTIAQRLGLDEHIVARARELMKTSEATLQVVIERLENKLKEIDERETDAAQAQAEAEAFKRSLDQEKHSLDAKLMEHRAKLLGDVEDELKLAKEYIKHLIADLQKQPSIPRAQKAQADLEKLKKELGWSDPPSMTAAPEKKRFKVGDRVRVLSLRQAAVVEAVPQGGDERNGQVSVRVGNLRIKVGAGDLEPLVDAAETAKPKDVPVKKPPTQGPRAVRSSEPPPFVRTDNNTIDVRGQRVDDALIEIERFLDRCLLEGLDTAMIIHGHGTGAVRSAVRALLDGADYVRSFRPGENHEGGNGVSIILLNS